MGYDGRAQPNSSVESRWRSVLGILRRWGGMIALALVLAPVAACTLPFASGPDWQTRRLILIAGVCLDVAGLPPPPALPPGLPIIPVDPHLPDWLACSTTSGRVDARERAITTFDPLLSRLRTGGAGAQRFRDADLRIYSFDPADPLGYNPASTRVALSAAVTALQKEFTAWHRREPRVTFDIAGYSLGGMIALAWAAQASSGDLAYVHGIVTLDSPVAGYPLALEQYVRSYLAPLFGSVAEELIGDSAAIRAIARSPTRWRHGAGQASNAIFCIGNLRDVIVPAFTATLAGTDGVLDDFGAGPDAFNHGAVLRSSRALGYASTVLQAAGGPQLRDQP
jgi:hypothetical protein